MVCACCVLGCKSIRSLHPEISFFRFPSKTKRFPDLVNQRKAAWIRAIGREFKNVGNLRVCSKHFITGKAAKLSDISNPDWTPSINLSQQPQRSNLVALKIKRLKMQGKKGKQKKHTKSEVPLLNFQESTERQPEGTATNRNDLLLVNDSDNRVANKPNENKNNDKTNFFEKMADLAEKNLQISDYKRSLENAKEQITSLAEENARLKARIECLENKCAQQSLKRDSFEKDDAKVKYFTGLTTYEILSNLYEFVMEDIPTDFESNLDGFDVLIMTLLKLKLDLPFPYLAYKYGVSIPTISEVFFETLHVLYGKLEGFVAWPDKNELKKKTPPLFLSVFGDTFTAIVDCFEIFTESPDKHHHAIKYLIAISSTGSIIFVSKGYGSRCSDKTIIEDCGLLEMLSAGDTILGDHGKLVQQIVLQKGTKMLVAVEIEQSQKLATVRIQFVERIIGNVRQKYLILSNHQPISITSKKNGEDLFFDYILKVCCALTNLNPSIVV